MFKELALVNKFYTQLNKMLIEGRGFKYLPTWLGKKELNKKTVGWFKRTEKENIKPPNPALCANQKVPLRHSLGYRKGEDENWHSGNTVGKDTCKETAKETKIVKYDYKKTHRGYY